MFYSAPINTVVDYSTGYHTLDINLLPNVHYGPSILWPEPPHVVALVAFTELLTNRLSSIHTGKAIMSL